MSTVHWLGAGLSATPGIRRLCRFKIPIVVYDPTPAAAAAAVAPYAGQKHVSAIEKDWTASIEYIEPGDVVVSMLPASFHSVVAQHCLSKSAHFVTASYCSEDIREMHGDAVKKELCFISEIGLDPGIDHLFAHKLVENYQQSPAYHPENKLRFTSYCGGIPYISNDFRYKFSWSPKGVLSALRSPATWIENFDTRAASKPWTQIRDIKVDLPGKKPTEFEAYPNRDSLPFLNQYRFDENWVVEEFVRGSLRLKGWKNAWKDIFETIESVSTESDTDKILSTLSDELWSQYAYEDDEPDRVVLHVQLQAIGQNNESVWKQAFAMDEIGDTKSGSAMARLVSLPVSYAVESILDYEVSPGLHLAVSDSELIETWLSKLENDGNRIIELSG